MKRVSIIGLVLIALAASACNALATAPVPTAAPPTVAPTATMTLTATPAPTATATTAPTSANPLDALKNLVGGWVGVKTFRSNYTVTKGTTTTTGTIDFVLPDRMHLVTKTSDIYVIANVWYVKVGKNWVKSAPPAGTDLSFLDWKKLLSDLGAATDVKLIGPDVLDGAPMLVYQYTIKVKTPVAFTSTTKDWVAVSDHLPRKSDTQSSLGTHTVATYSNFGDPTIVVNPPIP